MGSWLINGPKEPAEMVDDEEEEEEEEEVEVEVEEEVEEEVEALTGAEKPIETRR